MLCPHPRIEEIVHLRALQTCMIVGFNATWQVILLFQSWRPAGAWSYALTARAMRSEGKSITWKQY